MEAHLDSVGHHGNDSRTWVQFLLQVSRSKTEMSGLSLSTNIVQLLKFFLKVESYFKCDMPQLSIPRIGMRLVAIPI